MRHEDLHHPAHRAHRRGAEDHRQPARGAERPEPHPAGGARRRLHRGRRRRRRARHHPGRRRQALLGRPRSRQPAGDGGPEEEPARARLQGRVPAPVGALLREHHALARPPEADHRAGPGLLHHGRHDDRLGLRPHHRQRRRAVRRPRREVGRRARAVFLDAVGSRSAQGQGVSLHRRLHHARPRPRRPAS